MTPRQKCHRRWQGMCVFRDVYVATQHGGWYRAESNGERVTLASLWRAGAIHRRAWRGNEGDADAAYEYQWWQAAAS